MEYVSSFSLLLLLLLLLFILERERVREQERGAEGERNRIHAGSTLSAEPDTGLNPMTWGYDLS